jgi:hypothetical protein
MIVVEAGHAHVMKFFPLSCELSIFVDVTVIFLMALLKRQIRKKQFVYRKRKKKKKLTDKSTKYFTLRMSLSLNTFIKLIIKMVVLFVCQRNISMAACEMPTCHKGISENF